MYVCTCFHETAYICTCIWLPDPLSFLCTPSCTSPCIAPLPHPTPVMAEAHPMAKQRPTKPPDHQCECYCNYVKILSIVDFWSYIAHETTLCSKRIAMELWFNYCRDAARNCSILQYYITSQPVRWFIVSTIDSVYIATLCSILYILYTGVRHSDSSVWHCGPCPLALEFNH